MSASENNFDLIRLIAALQVATFHIFGHLHAKDSIVLDVVALFPGVPIFFFISGYLVPHSLERVGTHKNGLRVFFNNRFLRLFPALWICFAASLLAVFATGYFSATEVPPFTFSLWVLAQNTIMQFYNPEFMRGFGTGVLNGALWTISVEIQFYLLTPLIVYLVSGRSSAILLLVIICAVFNLVQANDLLGGSTVAKLYSVSFLPWIYMFLLGYLFRTNKQLAQFVLSTPVVVWILLYLVVQYFSRDVVGGPNAINPIALVLLCCLSMKVAFTKPQLSQVLLGRTDISYGIYIYHMLVVNVVLYLNLPLSDMVEIMLSYVLVFALGLASWHLIEKRALSLKSYSSRKQAGLA